jgi:hypothetical protein
VRACPRLSSSLLPVAEPFGSARRFCDEGSITMDTHRIFRNLFSIPIALSLLVRGLTGKLSARGRPKRPAAASAKRQAAKTTPPAKTGASRNTSPKTSRTRGKAKRSA